MASVASCRTVAAGADGCILQQSDGKSVHAVGKYSSVQMKQAGDGGRLRPRSGQVQWWNHGGFSVQCTGRNLRKKCAIFRRERKGPGMSRAVLDKSASGTAGSEGGQSDPVREALERLFMQAQRQEAQRLEAHRTGMATPGGELEMTVSALEVDLNAALSALRCKEEELRSAEKALKADQWEVQMAKSELQKQEQELQTVSATYFDKKAEISRSQKQLAVQAGELQTAKRLLQERDEEIAAALMSLGLREEELVRLGRRLREQDVELLRAASDLQAKDLELRSTIQVVTQQAAEMEDLRAKVKEMEYKVMSVEKEVQMEEKMLAETLADLEKRVVAWLQAEEEMKILEEELQNEKKGSEAINLELAELQALLVDVQEELTASQASIAVFGNTVEEQKRQLEQQEKELESQKQSICMQADGLEAGLRQLAQEREQVLRSQAAYMELERQFSEETKLVAELQLQLAVDKDALKDAVAEVNALKRELQQRDSALADSRLGLEQKDAELQAAKVDIKELKAEFAEVHRVLEDKGHELELAEKRIRTLEQEVVQVRVALRSKEQLLANSMLALRQKDDQMVVMKADLDESRLKLAEATAVMEQITSLSTTLVAATQSPSRSEESSVLMQTNCDLFAANRAVLEKELQLQKLYEDSASSELRHQEVEAELEAVKESLKDKNEELLNAQRALVNKEQELKPSVVARAALQLTGLAEPSDEDVAVSEIEGFNLIASGKMQRLELEVVKLEAETAMSALLRLAELSQELLSHDSMEHVAAAVAPPSRQSGHSIPSTSDNRSKVVELDVDRMKIAMADLANLTRKLVLDAGKDLIELGEPCLP